MRFESLENVLNRRYEYTTIDDNTKWYLLNDRVVAIKKKDLIIMYFQGNVVVAVAKDFLLLENYKKKVADVIVAGELNKYNTVRCVKNQLITLVINLELEKYLGTIGYVVEKGRSYEFYDRSVTILLQEDNSVNFSLTACAFEFGVLTQKKNARIIQPKDYCVFDELYKRRPWQNYKEIDDSTREKILGTKDGTNFSCLSKAELIIK